ncbi:[Fe-Fe] hydrogenase large subunit C-terminal domain-containing protein [Caproiciproducens sp. R1]|uniref:[Fe-Fe] hydrogenase large subunit C-terminal domain-containing protein n=1 Tax=Caproiciproducens sp. R1 TaxID=3435000 RepID=UPI004034A0C5
MEEIIGLNQSNCKNCYKCIRNCPVKSIAYRNEQIHIIGDECIYCGNCLLICPQNAKYINSDLSKVKQAIRAGEKLYVSLAPSYIAAFPETGIAKISAALKQLGFAHVEETAIGAEQVTREYEKLIREHKMQNMITTSCPSVNLLIEKNYPSLIHQLAPVVTPLIAHARMIKQIYGIRAKIVFIGPCISKKYECVDPDNGNLLFSVLTFDELEKWFREENVDFSQDDHNSRTLKNTLPRYYPAPGGIIKNLHRKERSTYECLSVDGVDRCIEILDSVVHDNLSGYFLELNACSGGCLGGPILKLMNLSFLNAKNVLVDNVKRANEAPPALTEGVASQFTKRFRNRSAKKEIIDEEKIRSVLASTGKTSPEKELNCGCCGYNTCREKAIAVLQGKANINMCIPYMRELAESMSNTVVEHTPTGILVINDHLQIEQINPSATQLLKLGKDCVGLPVEELLPSRDFEEVLQTGKNILNHKQYYKELGLILEQTVVHVSNNQLIFVLLKDITQQEQVLEEQRKVTEKTAAFAREVVNKQMRVVQEIADLLGETTCETKVALLQLTENIVPGAEDKNGHQH